MRIVIDTNVVLDVLANRAPFTVDSEAVLNLAASEKIEIAITANTITDIAYLLRNHLNHEDIKVALLGLMELLDVIEVNYEQCIEALNLPMSDYEDAVSACCAKSWGANFIVTRNTKDFTDSPIKALTPTDFLQQNISHNKNDLE